MPRLRKRIFGRPYPEGTREREGHLSIVPEHEHETAVHVIYCPHDEKELSGHMPRPLWGSCALLAILVVPLPLPAQDYPPDVTRGKEVYERHCQGCHGPGGRGDGPEAASWRVKPADFHRFASYLKSDEDLLRTVEHGIVFSPMHSWRGQLTDGEMQDVVAYIRVLSQQVR